MTLLTLWVGLLSLFKEETPFSRKSLYLNRILIKSYEKNLIQFKLEIYGIIVIGGAGKKDRRKKNRLCTCTNLK